MAIDRACLLSGGVLGLASALLLVPCGNNLVDVFETLVRNAQHDMLGRWAHEIRLSIVLVVLLGIGLSLVACGAHFARRVRCMSPLARWTAVGAGIVLLLSGLLWTIAFAQLQDLADALAAGRMAGGAVRAALESARDRAQGALFGLLCSQFLMGMGTLGLLWSDAQEQPGWQWGPRLLAVALLACGVLVAMWIAGAGYALRAVELAARQAAASELYRPLSWVGYFAARAGLSLVLFAAMQSVVWAFFPRTLDE
jgi:hypothetical protein